MKSFVCFLATVAVLMVVADAMPHREDDGYSQARLRRSPVRPQRRFNRRQDTQEAQPCSACDFEEVLPIAEEEQLKEAAPEAAPIAEVFPAEEPLTESAPVAAVPEVKAAAPKDSDEDDSDDAPFTFKSNRRGTINTFFPISFGGFGARSESGLPGGIVAVANSFSTGRRSAATSQAKAYGSGASKN